MDLDQQSDNPNNINFISDLIRNLYNIDGFDPRQHIANFIQPNQQHNLENSANLVTSSPSQTVNQANLSVSKGKQNCTSTNPISSNINGMANIPSQPLLTASVAFPSNSQQLPIQTSQHSPVSLQNNSGSQLVQQLNRSRVKNRSSSNSNNSVNGISNIPSQQIFGTSVAFPGNPLQPVNQVQNQNFQQSRPNQMQQQSQQQSVLSLPLDVSSINTSQSRNIATNSSSNSLTSNNAAAVAAAVAVAHPQYTQYITSWPCPACKIGFRSANELQTHLSAHFVPSQKQTQSNSVVNTNFNNNTQSFNSDTSKKDQSVHMKKDKSVPCNECGKMFASAERVRVHVRVAHGEKTCSCEICGCGFSYRCKLLNHMRTHTGDKPFSCEVCGRSFSQKNHLKRHHMIHTGERPFPCDICGRSFYRKDKLTRHRRIHTNPNPGRGARNSKNTIGNPVNVNQVKMPATQSFASLPASAIQLIPVSMSTQIRGAGSLGHGSWVPSLPNSRPNSQTSVDNLQKSPEHPNQRNQSSSQMKQEL